MHDTIQVFRLLPDDIEDLEPQKDCGETIWRVIPSVDIPNDTLRDMKFSRSKVIADMTEALPDKKAEALLEKVLSTQDSYVKHERSVYGRALLFDKAIGADRFGIVNNERIESGQTCYITESNNILMHTYIECNEIIVTAKDITPLQIGAEGMPVVKGRQIQFRNQSAFIDVVDYASRGMIDIHTNEIVITEIKNSGCIDIVLDKVYRHIYHRMKANLGYSITSGIWPLHSIFVKFSINIKPSQEKVVKNLLNIMWEHPKSVCGLDNYWDDYTRRHRPEVSKGDPEFTDRFLNVVTGIAFMKLVMSIKASEGFHDKVLRGFIHKVMGMMCDDYGIVSPSGKNVYMSYREGYRGALATKAPDNAHYILALWGRTLKEMEDWY